MCGSTFLLGSSGFDRRNARKISFLLFLSPLSLSLSLSDLLSFSHVCFPSLFFSFLFSLSYRPNILPFCLLPHLIFTFSHLSFFSYFSHFHFYFFFFIFSFLFLIWIASTECSKSGGNFPPLSSIATCHHYHFFS